jgi:hypothetical protein
MISKMIFHLLFFCVLSYPSACALTAYVRRMKLCSLFGIPICSEISIETISFCWLLEFVCVLSN